MLFKSFDRNQPLAIDKSPYVVNIKGYKMNTDFFMT